MSLLSKSITSLGGGASSGAVAGSTGGSTQPSNLANHVMSLNLLQSIQTNDVNVILPLLKNRLAQEVSATSTTSSSTPTSSTTAAPTTTSAYGSPLHLAISICSKHVVEQIILQLFLDPYIAEQVGAGPSFNTDPPWVNATNSPDGDTPLHLAVKHRMYEVAELLLKVKGINETIKDSHGRTPEELIPKIGAERFAELFKRARTEFITKTTSTIQAYAAVKNPTAIIDHFARDARAMGYLVAGRFDINTIIETYNMSTLLHFAACEDSLALVEWALSHGADPDIKDRKGRKAIDLVSKKDGKLRERLKNAMQTPVVPAHTVSTSGSQHPAMLAGSLKKWVNYSSGWKTRYFCLENGKFSYYKSEADYPESCRGSISTKIAVVEFVEPKDKSRFDVVGKGSVRYSLQAKTPADAKKWVWALMESKRWMLDNRGDETSPLTSQLNMALDFNDSDNDD
ncbi:hypothetical protein HDU76_013991, partial [Blyttiomyces sp. JEL0837]